MKTSISLVNLDTMYKVTIIFRSIFDYSIEMRWRCVKFTMRIVLNSHLHVIRNAKLVSNVVIYHIIVYNLIDK